MACLAACSAPATLPELTAAETQRRSGATDASAASYRRAQARCQELTPAWRARAACAEAQLGEAEVLEAAQRVPQALAAYRRALAAPASDAVAATACVRIGRLELARGQEATAWQALWQVVTDWPDEPAAGDAVRLLVQDGRGRDARALVHELGEVLTQAPQSQVADNLLWAMADLTERELANPATARALYDRIPRDTPTSGLRDDARWHAARISRALGDGQGAARRLRELLATREVALGAGSYFSIWLDDAQLELGRILRDELGDPRAAAAALAQLERDYPASTLVDDALWERALALRQAQNLAAACRALRELTRRFSSSKYAARGRALAGELRCEGGP
ncbi:MAG: tetratricopeptide repeat protein [Myxococcales bacterium]|nr:tetratricopeptide repeat protein [Myxococcales bacterium]